MTSFIQPYVQSYLYSTVENRCIIKKLVMYSVSIVWSAFAFIHLRLVHRPAPPPLVL